MNLSKSNIWRLLREQKILRTHRRVAAICQSLVEEYDAHPVHYQFSAKYSFDTDRIIWQYWAQGYESVPAVVQKCLASIEHFASDYTIVRLTDANLIEYIDIPDFIWDKRKAMSVAHFSDLLRLMLLSTYGGIWIDATVQLTAPIPEEYASQDFFIFRRDPQEANYKYWRNVYAYYFGWAKGFRVNMLSSFMVSKRSNPYCTRLCDLLLYWWQTRNELPDYFFLQIMEDVISHSFATGMIVSDTLPHYLQQSIVDPSFSIMSREDIVKQIPIHKMTYK